MLMKNNVELPLVEPIYSTYHYHGTGAAIINANPSIRNWYLNQVMNLRCSKKFLEGFTSPELNIDNASWHENPYLEKKWHSTQFAKGHINYIIRELLNCGYYVYFKGVDDYYVKGKTWYKQRHFDHDGLICGYDQELKTYSVFAYDENWIYRKFPILQAHFNEGRKALERQNVYGSICGLKPLEKTVNFDSSSALDNIKIYLTHPTKTQFDSDENIHGIIVQEYICLYIGKLISQEIPYERMDRRIFRLIWEHKKVMLERIQKIENELGMDNELSLLYMEIVELANRMRMQYASHHMRKRDSVLPTILLKLKEMIDKEYEFLYKLIYKAERG